MYTFPPKAKASAAGEVLEYVSAGSGVATVVLVNGSGGPIEGWYKIFEPVASFAKVFAYNRPGIGGSYPPQSPQRGSHMVESLRTVLRAARFSPPYILVGHSLGGLIVNLFARLYPAEVSAAILVEATAPQDIDVLLHHENVLQRMVRKLLNAISPPHPNAESQHVQATVSELQGAPSFPSIPLTVISGGKPAMAWATPAEALAARAKHQKAMAALSPKGRHVIAGRSGHFPQFSEPELIVAAIKDAVSAAPEGDAPKTAQLSS